MIGKLYVSEGEIPGFAGASEGATSDGEGEGRQIRRQENFTSSVSFEQSVNLGSYFSNVESGVQTLYGTVCEIMLSTGWTDGGCVSVLQLKSSPKTVHGI